MEGFWKVCEALDNPRRLRLLDVLTVNRPRCVSELAWYHGIATPLISRDISALDGAGFLAVEWRNRKAYYRTSPQNNTAAEILDALFNFFNRHASDSERVAKLLKYIHALSHPRRAAIVRFVWLSPEASINQISTALGMPIATTSRLLRDLDHAYIVDLSHRAIPPEEQPELTFFELLVSD